MGEWSIVQEEMRTQGLILSFSNIADAPQVPGLYAWYAFLGLGEADLNQESQTRSALRRQTSKYKPSSMQNEVKGNLGARWSGQLVDTSMNELAKLLEGDGGEANSEMSSFKQQRSKRLRQTLAEHSSRQALIDTLEKSIPIFFSPLYVGISENLNNRLRSHVNTFRIISRNRSAVVEEDSDLEDPDDASGASFAARAVNSGFKEDNLHVFVLPFHNHYDLNPSQVRDVIGAVEYLLNRWTKPSLGVR